jgi:predicted dehydrogenase
MRGLVSRRQFLRRGAAVGVGVTVIPEGLAFGSRANEQIRIAQIGCGGRGGWFVNAIPQIGERHVAMCDVDQDRAAESYKKMPDVPKFADYRRMLEEKDKEIDAVIIAAPDHIHGPAGVMAMRMGKHLYCEKPLTNTINEARVMRRVANETGVATQMGNQGTATHAFREQVEILQTGGLGDPLGHQPPQNQRLTED